MAKYGIAAILLLSLCFACSTRSLRPSESEALTQNGKEIGHVRQLNDTEREYVYDANRDGRPEYQWRTKADAIAVFEKFNPVSGKLVSRSHYRDGRIRGIVSYPDGKTARSVELPQRKRLVEFVSR